METRLIFPVARFTEKSIIVSVRYPPSSAPAMRIGRAPGLALSEARLGFGLLCHKEVHASKRDGQNQDQCQNRFQKPMAAPLFGRLGFRLLLALAEVFPVLFRLGSTPCS